MVTHYIHDVARNVRVGIPKAGPASKDTTGDFYEMRFAEER